MPFVPPRDPYFVRDREIWLPQIKAGYEYINDRTYYLYGSKKTVTLQDATCLIFELADTPVPGSMSLTVEGVAYGNFIVEGNKLLVKMDDEESFVTLWSTLQFDLDQWGFILHGFGFGPSNEVVATYEILSWQPGVYPTGDFFSRGLVTEVFKIKDADRIEYRLTRPDAGYIPSTGQLYPTGVLQPTGFIPEQYQDCAPVIITDDSLEPENPIDWQLEFAVDPITGEIIFNANRNYVQNPNFGVSVTGVVFDEPEFPRPSEWRVTDVPGMIRLTGEAYHGQYCYQINGTGQFIQTVKIDPNEPITLSLQVKNGIAQLDLNFLDESGTYIGAEGQISVTGQPIDSLAQISATGGGNDWTPLVKILGEPAAFVTTTGEISPIPDEADELEIRIGRYSGQPCIDAVQLERGYEATQFNPLLGPNVTIEFETDPLGLLTKLPIPDDDAPVQIEDLDCNPVSVPDPGGFLFVEEFSNVDDFQLGIGEFTEEDAVSPTGVLDFTGGVDVVVGRRHLPYAKVSGWNKYRQRATFHLENPDPVYDISDLGIENSNPLPVPKFIEIVPTEGTRVVGDEIQLVVVPDANKPVRIDILVEDGVKNPAFVYQGAVSTSTVHGGGKVGNVIPTDPVTSHQGALSVQYVPPPISGTGDLGKIDDVVFQVGDAIATLPVFGYRSGDATLDYPTFYQL